MLTIPISLPQNDQQLNKTITMLKNAKADSTMINVCEIFLNGKEREEYFLLLKKAISALKQSGFRTGVWMSTLGYGTKRGPKFDEMFPSFTPITAFLGRTGGAVCVHDKALLEYNKQNVIDFAKSGADLILLDDEFVLSVRPGFTCACELHRKEFEKITGKLYTGEEISEFFTGGPNELRTAWMDMTGKSLLDYCKALREAVNSVSPTIRMGLCASYTHYDLDGFNIRDCIKILAGNNKPYLRLSGAAYWPKTNPRYAGQTMSGVIEFSRMQIGWLENEGIEITDENDPYPRNSELVLPKETETFDKATITCPNIRRFKYAMDHGHDLDQADLGYYNGHIERMKDSEKMAAFFEGKRNVGIRVFVQEQKIRDVTLPDEYMGDKPLMAAYTNSYTCAILAKYGIPTVYSGNGTVFVCGEDARYLPEDIITDIVVADTVASEILKQRNISCVELPIDASNFDFTNPPEIGDTLISLFKNLPVVAKGLYPLVSENDTGDEMAILLINDHKEKDKVNPKVILNAEYDVVDTINCNAAVCGEEITIDCVNALDYAAILLKKK